MTTPPFRPDEPHWQGPPGPPTGPPPAQPPGQPPGQPPAQPPGQPPGQWQPGGYGQYPPPPAPPPPGKKRVGLIVLLVLLLVGGGVAGFVLLRKDDTPAVAKDQSPPGSAGESTPASPAPDPGICIEATAPSVTAPEVAEVPCDAPEAAYEVAKRLDKADDSCPSDDYDTYTETGIGDGYTLCLMLNGEEGACLANVDSTSLLVEREDCATARFKVIKAVDGEAAESACPTGETIVPLTYPEPPTTVCVEAI